MSVLSILFVFMPSSPFFSFLLFMLHVNYTNSICCTSLHGEMYGLLLACLSQALFAILCTVARPARKSGAGLDVAFGAAKLAKKTTPRPRG